MPVAPVAHIIPGALQFAGKVLDFCFLPVEFKRIKAGFRRQGAACPVALVGRLTPPRQPQSQPVKPPFYPLSHFSRVPQFPVFGGVPSPTAGSRVSNPGAGRIATPSIPSSALCPGPAPTRMKRFSPQAHRNFVTVPLWNSL